MTDDMFRVDEPLSILGRRNFVRKIQNKERRMSKSRRMTTDESTSKKPRTSEDFYLFCKFILEYENYEVSEKEDSQDISVKVENVAEDEDDGGEQSSDGLKSSNSDDNTNSVNESSSDEDSYDLVTCFCGKPFAGRPMIECSKCLTWIHLRCAKVKKSDIPDVFICSNCKDKRRE